MRGLVIAVPLLLFFGFIPFSVIMEEIFGQSLFFFIVMMVYVILFPLSPFIAAGLIGGKRGIQLESEVKEANGSSRYNGEPEAVGWWNSDMTENDGYQ